VIEALKPSDVVVVTRLYRLVRSSRDPLNTLAAMRAGFRSLGDTWADTTIAHGRPMAVLGSLPSLSATLSGRARAKARGQHMGRPPKLTLQKQKEARRRTDGTTLKELAKIDNMGVATISRLSAGVSA
jgi:DNA invertase Pin-like site-specific DNA recombinase